MVEGKEYEITGVHGGHPEYVNVKVGDITRLVCADRFTLIKKFAVGDKVCCVKNERDLVPGEHYDITALAGDFVRVNGNHLWWPSNRFVKGAPTPFAHPPRPGEFVAGDLVKCIVADTWRGGTILPGDRVRVAVVHSKDVFEDTAGRKFWADRFVKVMEAPKDDPIYQPSHYSRFVIEPITFINANSLSFNIGNVIKYVCRHDAKDGIEDLKKARRYIDMEIECQERKARVLAGNEPQQVWKVAL